MGFKWDSKTQTWVDDGAEAPAAVPATTEPTGPDYSGGFLSDVGAFLGGAKKEAGELLRATPGAIKEFAKDVGKAGRLAGETAYGDYIAPVIPGHPGTEKVEGPLGPEYQTGYVQEFKEKVDKAIDRGIEQRGENPAGYAQGFLNALQEAPVTRFDPNVYLADKASKGRQGLEEMAQEPLVAGLNILPGANQVTRGLTKGKPLARAAETRLAEAGEFNRAARVAERGADIRDVVGEKVRQTAPGKKAAELLEESALGGRNIRNTLRKVGTFERKYQKDLNRYIESEVKNAVDEFGMTPEDVVDLTQMMEFPPQGNWKAQLPENKRSFLRWYEGQIGQFKKLGVGEGKLFDFEGETYAKSEAPGLSKNVRRLARVKPLEEMVTYQRAQEAGIKALETGVLEGMTPGELSMHAPQLAKKFQDIRLRKAAQYERINAKLRKSADITSPTRFRPLIMRSEAVVDDIIKTVENRIPEQDWAFTEQAIREGRGLDFLDDAERAKVLKNVGASWRKLADAGFDPVYVHHVPIDSLKRGLGRFIPFQIRSADDVKRRGWDMRPWVQDATVALSHQAADWMRKEHATTFVDDLVRNRIARSQAAVRRDAYRSVRRTLEKQYPDVIPENRIAAEVDQYISKHYEAFDPETMFSGHAGLGVRGAYYLPKGIAKVFDQLSSPPRAAKAQSALGKTFRYSVLYLNPFYYIDNAISGALLGAARSDLGVINPLRIKRAWNLLHSEALPDELSVGGSRYASFEESQKGWRRASAGAALGDEFMKRYLGESQGNASKAAGKASALLERTAAITDDMWKTVTYLNEFEKLTKKGVGKEAAVARAVETAHRVLMNFSEMTPFERTAVRSMLPFYSWTRHILKYVMSYPFDHPYRTAFITNLGDQWREEWPEGLPERFMKYWFLSRNEDGTMLFPNTGVVPWVSVGDVTDDPFKGFLMRLDPKFQAVAEARGLDPFTFAPDIYLKEKYNPVSGFSEPVLPSPWQAFINNIVPQTETLRDVFMPDEDLKEYYEEHPDRKKDALLRIIFGKTATRRDLDEEAKKATDRKVRSDTYWAKQEAKKEAEKQPVTAGGGTPQWNPQTQTWEFR